LSLHDALPILQIKIEETKNTKKFLSFKSLIASNPIIDEMLGFSVLSNLIGGVLGNVKLNSPNTKDAMDAIKNVFLSSPFSTPSALSQPNTNDIAKPATIQPIVPKSLIVENCFSGLAIWLTATELTTANVGINEIIQANTYGNDAAISVA